jgi:hypothetical protein
MHKHTVHRQADVAVRNWEYMVDAAAARLFKILSAFQWLQVAGAWQSAALQWGR